MPRRLIPTILFAAQFLFCVYPAPAQSTASSSSCPCTLQGSVVDSTSGQPIPHALVRLSAPSPRAMLTDSEGKFQFESLPAGSVTLEGEKPGFLTRDPLGRWSLPSVTLQLTPNTPPALLKLIPEGVITGQVSGENGEPLEGVTIRISPRSLDHRGLSPDVLQRPAITDDQGKFRIAGLRTGSYYLVGRLNQAPALNAAGKSTPPSGYSPVFYPGVNDIASAVALKVLPGRTVQANLSLKREPFIQLSGIVSGYNSQEQVSLMLKDSSGMLENTEVTFDSSTGSFHTKWIPPGFYTLTAQSAGDVSVEISSESPVIINSGRGAIRVSRSSFARVTLRATSSQSDLHLTLQPMANIPVVLRGLAAPSSEGLQSVPPLPVLISKQNGAVGIISYSPAPNPQGEPSSADLRLLFFGIAPGTYELGIAPRLNTSYYVESATWGSTDLLRDDLVLDSSGSVPPIEITVRDNGATLNGKIFSGDIPPAAQVVLLADKRNTPISLPVNSDGTFAVSGLAPGVYRVFAVDGSADFDYEDPAFLTKISSKIQEITLGPKQSASINLELAAVGE